MAIGKSQQWWKKKANAEEGMGDTIHATYLAAKNANRDKKRSRQRLAANLSLQDKLTAVSVRYFGKVAGKLEARMPTLGEDLLKSNYYLSPNGFLAIVIFATILSIPIAIFGAVMTI